MRKTFLAIAALLASATVVEAQNTSGILLNRDIVPASSFVSLSQREPMGTARSMGMGGAFTSLGADMASFGYNPAGFGMYQRNEVSATLGMGISHAKNYNAYSASGNTNTRVAVNNIGASFKVYEGTGNLVAVNFALGYNKTADYNYNMSYESGAEVGSLADAFADMAKAGGLLINGDNKITDSRGYVDYDMDPYYWGTVLGYKGGLINRGANGWLPDEIAGGAQMTQVTDLQSRGSAGEFSFAFGFNINNILYLGASLDIQSISRKQDIYYSEYINYAADAKPNAKEYPYLLQNFDYAQSMTLDGSGVGAKFGIVVRPIEALRIGFAVHTPTYYSIAYRYSASLYSEAIDTAKGTYIEADEATPILQDGGDHRWIFTTPTRLLTGLSYMVGPYAVFSVDYQYDAYRSLQLNYAPTDTGYDSTLFRHNLKGVHTLRVGVEAKPMPWLSVRVGGGLKSRILASDFNFVTFSEPIEDRSWSLSAGVGFRLSQVTSIDLAYQYRNNRYSDYYSFYTHFDRTSNASPLYGLDILKHNIALTFAFRF